MGNVRVRGHDYHGHGYYFITFGTFQRRHCLSKIKAGKVVLKAAGKLLLEAWQRLSEEDPAYELGVTAVMPDHFHALAICRSAPKYVIGSHVSRVKGRVLQALRKQLNVPDLQLWEDGFYDYLSLDTRMLEAFKDYVNDNPARWQLRRDNPQWFQKQYALLHPRLPSEVTWTAYGDATLLDHPLLIPVIVSRKISEQQRNAQIERILALVKQGGIPISGFISPGERQVAKALYEMPRSRIIKLLPWGLKRYKPSGSAATRWMAEGRMLVLSGFPDNEPVECRRANCMKNNEWTRFVAQAPLLS